MSTVEDVMDRGQTSTSADGSCELHREGDWYVMRCTRCQGNSAEHRLYMPAAPYSRLRTHWTGFKANHDVIHRALDRMAR